MDLNILKSRTRSYLLEVQNPMKKYQKNLRKFWPTMYPFELAYSNVHSTPKLLQIAREVDWKLPQALKLH